MRLKMGNKQIKTYYCIDLSLFFTRTPFARSHICINTTTTFDILHVTHRSIYGFRFHRIAFSKFEFPLEWV